MSILQSCVATILAKNGTVGSYKTSSVLRSLNLRIVSWLYSKELSFIETCRLWSLIYKENDGMFCLLCRKHNTGNLRNNSDTWNATPSIRFRRSSFVEHFATEQHKHAVQSEMLQRVSSFQKEYEEKWDLNDVMLEKAFTAVYWIAEEDIANVKLASLRQLHENLGVSKLKYLSQRSRPAVREMFLIISEVLKEHYLEKINKSTALVYWQMKHPMYLYLSN